MLRPCSRRATERSDAKSLAEAKDGYPRTDGLAHKPLEQQQSARQRPTAGQVRLAARIHRSLLLNALVMPGWVCAHTPPASPFGRRPKHSRAPQLRPCCRERAGDDRVAYTNATLHERTEE